MNINYVIFNHSRAVIELAEKLFPLKFGEFLTEEQCTVATVQLFDKKSD